LSSESSATGERLVAWAKLRDAALFGATIVYALGYLTWCFYAWRHQLGFLPPLEGQYFVAGIAPGLLLAIAFVLYKRLEPAPTATARTAALRKARFALLVGGIFGIVGWISQDALSASHGFLAVLFWGGFALIALSWYFVLRGEERQTAALRGVFVVAIPALIAATFLLYVARVFPILPKPFGGPGPECVVLDIDGGLLSPDSRLALTGKQLPQRSEVLRSAPLWLQFEGNDLIVISEAREPTLQAVLRVRAAAVKATVPSSDCSVGADA
jgi:hypothetical protein